LVREKFLGKKILKNKIDFLDLHYLNADTSLSDFFVKYVGQEYSRQISRRHGQIRKTSYHQKILNVFPNISDRLIRDVESGEFEEAYSKGLFLTSNLPTGAKKECLLYLLNIIKEKQNDIDDWMAVFLIDEIESGLHINRQKKIVDALANMFSGDENILKNHIKIILTTHSPLIYSELQKYEEFTDVYYVLREPERPSVLLNAEDDVEDVKLAEKRILLELGMNIFEMPQKILFVEGITDKLFFDQIFSDVGIIPFRSGNIPQVIKDLISSHRIARTKEYSVVVDKNSIKKIDSEIEKIRKESDSFDVTINSISISYNSIEEFIFDIKLDGKAKTSTLWDRIEKKIELFDQTLEKENKGILEINVESARKNLERKGREGFKIFFDNIKNKNKNFYSTLGKHWRLFLIEKNIDFIKEFKSGHKLKFK